MSQEEESVPEISLRATQRARDLVGCLCEFLHPELKQAEYHEIRSMIEDFVAQEEDRTAEEVQAYKHGHRLMLGLSDEKCTEAIAELTAALNCITWILKKSGGAWTLDNEAHALAAGDRIKSALKNLGV